MYKGEMKSSENMEYPTNSGPVNVHQGEHVGVMAEPYLLFGDRSGPAKFAEEGLPGYGVKNDKPTPVKTTKPSPLEKTAINLNPSMVERPEDMIEI